MKHELNHRALFVDLLDSIISIESRIKMVVSHFFILFFMPNKSLGILQSIKAIKFTTSISAKILCGFSCLASGFIGSMHISTIFFFFFINCQGIGMSILIQLNKSIFLFFSTSNSRISLAVQTSPSSPLQHQQQRIKMNNPRNIIFGTFQIFVEQFFNTAVILFHMLILQASTVTILIDMLIEQKAEQSTTITHQH